MSTTKKVTTKKKAPSVRKKRVVKKKTASKKRISRKAAPRAERTDKPTQQTLTLDSVVVINNAQSLHHELAQTSREMDVVIDASAVEMIDTAILQLLYAFVIRIRSGNREIKWIGPSDEFVTRATLLGLSHHLGIS